MIRYLIIGIISVAAYSFIINNFLLMSRDMIHGDLSGETITPKPIPGFFRIQGRGNTIEHNAINRLALDYAQVYFPSQEFSALTKNYETGYLDPLKRPSRYAPFIHYVCSISFCKLEYGYASFFHMLTQMLLFYFFFILAFKELKIESSLWSGLILVNLFLFATPAGLGWFERGQFSLYVALSYMLLILGILKNKPVFFIASAFFAYVKWTSFPYLFVVFVTYLLSSKNKKGSVQAILLSLIYILIILLLSLAFRSRFIHFLEGIYTQELYIQPDGISLALLFPVGIVKVMPFLLILIGYFYLRRNGGGVNHLIPFLTGAGILLLIYPTISFEYTIPNLFCFIPFIFYWTKQHDRMSYILRFIFFLFILAISFPAYTNLFIGGHSILLVYLAISILFLLLPLIYTGEFSSNFKDRNLPIHS